MELPVRCFSCNTVLGNKWETIQSLREAGKTPPEIYQHFGFRRECCKFVVQTALAGVGESEYEYSTGEPMAIADIGTDVIDTRRRQNGVVTCHRAV